MDEKKFTEIDCGKVYDSLSKDEKSKCIIYLVQNVGGSLFTWIQRLPKWAKSEIPNKMKPLELERVYQIFQQKEWDTGLVPTHMYANNN